MESISKTRFFFRVWVPRLGMGLLISGGLRPPKGTLLERIHFPLAPSICSEALSCMLCAGYRIYRHFQRWFRPRYKLTEFFSAAEFVIIHTFSLCVCHRNRADSLNISGVMMHFIAFRMPGYALGSSFLAIHTRILISKIVFFLDIWNNYFGYIKNE